ncbi:hypothetical protein EUGRSUZ_C01803 [Eucalyptus grandis]|uniref:Uncharacterized protein n=2 Tax=Eucalyptus grandis TaxID=71139 RepID=A0ACC3LE22_EUCGR|nr:hypothetical protein EUGRSUZ_C01803 [Eucalyptus grandis]
MPKKVGPLIDVHPKAANVSEVFTSRSTSPTKKWLIKVVMSSIWSFSIHASSDANELLPIDRKRNTSYLKDQSNIQYSEEGSKYRLVRDAKREWTMDIGIKLLSHHTFPQSSSNCNIQYPESSITHFHLSNIKLQKLHLERFPSELLKLTKP